MSPSFSIYLAVYFLPHRFISGCALKQACSAVHHNGRSLVLVNAPVSNPYVLFSIPFLLINRPPQFTCQSANCFSFSSQEIRSQETKKTIRVHGCFTGNSVGHQNFLSPRSFSFFLSSLHSFPSLGPGLVDNTEVSFAKDRSIAKRIGHQKVHLPAHLRYTSFRTRYSCRDVLHFIPCEYVALHSEEPLPGLLLS